MKDLSHENLILLKYIFVFLHKVASCSASNRMNPHQLSLIFTSLFTENENPEPLLLEFVEHLIMHPDWIPKKQNTLMQSDMGDTSINHPKLFFSESILLFHKDIMLIVADNQFSGALFITNYQIVFVYKHKEDTENQIEISLPLFSLLSIERRGKDESIHLYIQSKDTKSFNVFFPSMQELLKYQEHLSHFVAPQSYNMIFAFNHGLYYEKDRGLQYQNPDYIQEFKRQGVQVPTDWRYFSYPQAKIYPKQVLIPSSIQEKLIQSVCPLYANNSFPTLMWQSPFNTFLLRAGAYIKESNVQQASVHPKDSPKPTSPRSETPPHLRHLVKTNSVLVVEKENPNLKNYIDSIIGISDIKMLQIIGCLLPSELKQSASKNRNMLTISDVEELFVSLREGIHSGIGSIKFTNALKAWKLNLSELILLSHTLSSVLLKEHLLIEDNGSANFRLTSLILLLNERYYRTIPGFFVLIEHVWIRFGYPFGDYLSIGRGSSPVTKIGAFVQFVDCVWQIWSQVPTAFEFNEEFLIEILDSVFSGCYGTFLGNIEKEYELFNSKTVSVWESMINEAGKYQNIFYKPSESLDNFDSSNKKTIFWSDYYLRLSTKDAFVTCCKDITESQLSKNPTFNLTHRKITSLPPSIKSCYHLTTIILSHSRLTTFPIILASLSKLETIDLSYNNIRLLSKTIIETLQNLSQLRSIDLSHNDLHSIDSSIATLIPSLQVLNIGSSKSSVFQFSEAFFNFENLHHLGMDGYNINFNFTILSLNIRSLSLSKTGLSGLGKYTFPHLESLILQENNISGLKDFGEFPSLTRLDLSNNLLVEIPEEVFKISSLKELYIRKNKIEIISPMLLKLQQLEVLDLQDNNFAILPPFFSKISSLRSFLFLSEVLQVPPKAVALKEFDVVKKFLSDRISHEVQTHRIRLMFVGQENVGKSSLMRALKTKTYDKKNISTDGIHIDEWKMPMEIGGASSIVNATVYDFAGQDIYYSSHQFFLASESIYLIIWNVLDRFEESKIEYWLESVKASSNSPIILVATHIDNDRCSKDFLSKELGNVAQKYARKFPSIKKITAVSCVNGKGINELSLILQEEIKKLPSLTAELPIKFEYLENHLISLRSRIIPPIIPISKFAEICSIFCIEEKDISFAAKTLHNWGSIFYHSDEVLNDIVIIDPSWLTKLMATILTTKHSYVKNGVVIHRDFIHIWHPSEYPVEFHKALYQILQKFEIIYPLKLKDDIAWEDTKSLVPILLSPQKPDIVNELFPRFDPIVLQHSRIFQFKFVPTGFVNHLFTRIIQFTTLEVCWKNGALAHELINNQKNSVLLELIPSSNELILTVRGANSVKLFLKCINIIESFTESWYRLDVTIQIPCPHCIRNRSLSPVLFSYSDCKEAAIKGSPYILCTSGNSVRLDTLTPDLSMTEVQRIDYNSIKIQKEIGKGGFATVYKAEYNNEIVALKVIDLLDPELLEAAYTDFVRECWIMSGLQHHNVIGFRGLCMEPLCILTDFANYGNLYDFLHSENNELAQSIELKLKISYDIACGMKFLHNRTPPIIHADLKSPNILLSSVNPSDVTVAVVADFGLSKSWVPVLQGRNVDNPVWLAPEILSGKEYTEKADVYSFGVILYEILTLKPFFGEYTFMSKMEDDIIKGKRPELPSDDNLDFVELIRDCWQNDPVRRPNFADIITRVNSIIQKLGFNNINIEGIVSKPNDDQSNIININLVSTDMIPNIEEHVETYSRVIGSLYPKNDFPVTTMISTNNCVDVWAATVNGLISVYNTEFDLARERTIPAHSNNPISVMIRVDDNIWTSSVDERLIKVWSGIDARLVQTIPTSSIEIISLLKVNSEVWAGSISGNIYTWNINGERGTPLTKHDFEVPFQFKYITDKLMDPVQGILLQTKIIKNKIIPHSFTGSELITWFVASGEATDRNQALQLGKSLRKHGVIYHVLNSSVFEDSDELFYRLATIQQSNIRVSSNEFLTSFSFEDPITRTRDVVNVSCMFYDTESKLVWIGHNNGILIFDYHRNVVAAKVIDCKSKLNQLLEVNNSIWVASMDNIIRIYHKKSLELLHTIESLSFGVSTMTLHNNFVWSACLDRSITVWCATTYSLIEEFRNPHSDVITALLPIKHNQKSVMLSASMDKSVLIWETNFDNNNELNMFVSEARRLSTVTNGSANTSSFIVHPDTISAVKLYKNELYPNLVMLAADPQQQKLCLTFSCRVNAIQLALQFPTDEPRFALYTMESDFSKKAESTGIFNLINFNFFILTVKL